MKKIITILLMLALVLCCSGACAIANPVTECASLAEMNSITGSKLQSLTDLGITDERFSVIDCGNYLISEYAFMLDGMACTLRNADVARATDISGYYDGEGTAFMIIKQSPEYYYADEDKLARWDTVYGEFVLCVNENGSMNPANFKKLADKVMTSASPAVTEDDLQQMMQQLEGNYQDEYSKRATAEVQYSKEENALLITIQWAMNADNTTEWTMSAVLHEDGLLAYNDCAKREIGDTNTMISENGSGYMEIVNSKLLWSGAAEIFCRSCVFAPMAQ